ncbi:MAG: apolipoprotein N-acyltransferase [Rhodobacteraceae bacterium]|nr:apolipoprotein N-acyltransferase [Paracoccaceae bacterium]
MTMPQRLRPVARLFAAIGLGAILAQGLAPQHHVWASVLALALVLPLITSARSPRQMATCGWALGLGYFAVGLWWIIEPFQVDPDRHAWMAPFALLFLAGGLALFWGAAFWGAGLLRGKRWQLVLALTLCWTLAEFGRAYLFTGLPWGAFAQFWIDTPLAAMLAFVGPHGLAFLTTFAGLSLGLVVWSGAHMSARLSGVLPAGLLAALPFVLPAEQPLQTTGKLVRLVQPNAPQHQKWDPAYQMMFYQRQLGFTAAVGEQGRPDLVVWPETSVPVLLENADPVLQQVAQEAGGAGVVLGLQSAREDRFFNSLVHVGPDGQVTGQYDKHHLVPFGEYVPFGDFMARFGIHGFAARSGFGFSAGPGAELIELPGIGRALPLICYEAVFPQDVNAAKDRPDLLIQITNDAWFGTRSGPFQHLVQARMRAIEQGVPMIRVANTGVSAMIDPYGQVIHQIPLGQAGFVDAELPRPLEPTLYSRAGDLPVFLAVVLGLLVLVFLLPLSKRRQRAANLD